MNSPSDQNFEAELREMTRWQGGQTRLWKTALGHSKREGSTATPGRMAFLNLKLSNWMLASVAFGCLFFVAVAINLPHLSRARIAAHASRDVLRSPDNKTANSEAPSPNAWFSLSSSETLRGIISPSTVESPERVSANLRGVGQAMYINAQDDPGRFSAEVDLSRQVVRKATIDLKTNDLRSVFLKAQHLVQPASGEYVQGSLISGSGPDALASLTLRVAADRMSEVMNQLRDLGEVISENQDGQDVTSQVVDLEARLRNEKRVEAELLSLLETRKDAPLKDVLDLRNALKDVRLNIERLTGERTELAKLVSLSTVLVIIHSAEAAKPDSTLSLGSYFGTAVSDAWNGGVLFLFDTAATLVRITVGGLLFWILLFAVIVVVRRYLKRRTA